MKGIKKLESEGNKKLSMNIALEMMKVKGQKGKPDLGHGVLVQEAAEGWKDQYC